MTSALSCMVISYNAQLFHIMSTMIQLLPQLLGVDRKNPYLHLKEFEVVCCIFQEPNYNMYIVRLKVFLFSLKEEVKLLLYGLMLRSIGSWIEKWTEFLKHYFPFQCTTTKKRKITPFKQNDNGVYHDCWERYWDLINSCSHCDYEAWRVVSLFYDRLTP